MMEKSIESGSAWCVHKEVDGEMSCVVRAGVDGGGERGGEGKRRLGEELGCWMHVWGIV